MSWSPPLIGPIFPTRSTPIVFFSIFCKTTLYKPLLAEKDSPSRSVKRKEHEYENHQFSRQKEGEKSALLHHHLEGCIYRSWQAVPWGAFSRRDILRAKLHRRWWEDRGDARAVHGWRRSSKKGARRAHPEPEQPHCRRERSIFFLYSCLSSPTYCYTDYDLCQLIPFWRSIRRCSVIKKKCSINSISKMNRNEDWKLIIWCCRN